MARLRRGLGNRTPNTKDAQAAAERKARRDKVFRMRREGFDLGAIAREVGVSVKQVQRDFARCMAAPPEGAEEARKLALARREQEIVRLETLCARLRPMANPEAGPVDMAAVEALAKLSRTKAIHQKAVEEMTVPELPEQHELSGPGGGPIPVAAAKTTISGLLEILEENEKAP